MKKAQGNFGELSTAQKKTMKEDKRSRREFIRESFKGVARSLLQHASELITDDSFRSEQESRQLLPKLIRPPGALPEEAFLERCSRCNECVKACPKESIMKFVGEESTNHLTPILLPRKSPCVFCEGFLCIQACRDGALIMPESAKEVQMGVAVINKKLCFAWQGQDCDYCIKECPFRGEAIFADDLRRPQVLKEKCVGCGQCEYICPGRQSAIIIKGI